MTPLERSQAETSRTVQAMATHDLILQVVVDRLDSGGEQAVRIRDVADTLGLSVGSIYHHFDGREALVIAGRAVQFRGAIAGDVEAATALVDRCNTVDEFRHGLRAFMRAAYGDSRARYRRRRAEAAGAAAHNPALRAELAAVQEDCTRQFAEAATTAQAKGLIDPAADPRVLATFMQMVPFGRLLDDLNTIMPMNADRWDDLVAELIESFLGPDDQSC